MTDKKNFWTDSDIGLLILRIAVGGLLSLHGIHKVQVGLDDQMALLAAKSIPTFFMYLVYITEVLAPALIILALLSLRRSMKVALLHSHSSVPPPSLGHPLHSSIMPAPTP